MKKLLLGCSLLSLLYLSSCKPSDQDDVQALKTFKAESIVDFDCLYKSADVPLTIADVKKEIYGEWQMKGIIAMVQSDADIPDVKLVISQKSDGKQLAEILNDGKLAFSSTFDLEQNSHNELKWVTIKPDREYFNDSTYNFIRGSIRICPGQLLIDNGMAFDAPAFLFRKNK